MTDSEFEMGDVVSFEEVPSKRKYTIGATRFYCFFRGGKIEVHTSRPSVARAIEQYGHILKVVRGVDVTHQVNMERVLTVTFNKGPAPMGEQPGECAAAMDSKPQDQPTSKIEGTSNAQC